MTALFDINSEWFEIRSISVPPDRRSVNDAVVKGLMESFEEVGQITPISCYFDPEIEAPVLVAGAHRLEAAKRLGWDRIDGVMLHTDSDTEDLDYELWSIDENLIRAELTDLERANHTARRAEIMKYKAESAKLAEMENDLYQNANKGQVDFVAETAAKTGKSFRAVERDKRRGEKIIPEVKDAIKDMPAADKGVELDALVGLEPDEQKQALARVQSGASKHFRDARDFIKGDPPFPGDLELARLKKAWQKAGGKAREEFLAWISQEYEKAVGT